ncbi:MAG: hypothetical protein JW781_08510 [Deltaproteobacteria bacterium]|nr:hypothetical protein [Candidatus Anaeroferrophillacea bacterium]
MRASKLELLLCHHYSTYFGSCYGSINHNFDTLIDDVDPRPIGTGIVRGGFVNAGLCSGAGPPRKSWWSLRMLIVC